MKNIKQLSSPKRLIIFSALQTVLLIFIYLFFSPAITSNNSRSPYIIAETILTVSILLIIACFEFRMSVLLAGGAYTLVFCMAYYYINYGAIYDVTSDGWFVYSGRDAVGDCIIITAIELAVAAVFRILKDIFARVIRKKIEYAPDDWMCGINYIKLAVVVVSQTAIAIIYPILLEDGKLGSDIFSLKWIIPAVVLINFLCWLICRDRRYCIIGAAICFAVTSSTYAIVNDLYVSIPILYMLFVHYGAPVLTNLSLFALGSVNYKKIVSGLA